MIQTRVGDAVVLDIFSGTGQIGIEAVSRGASKAYMVDRAGSAISVIRSNLQKIRADKDPRFVVLKRGYQNALKSLGEQGIKFDIIFLDPPYDIAHRCSVEIADLVNSLDLLSEDGIMIVESSSELPFDTDVINLQFNRSCRYGLTMITFFSKG